LLFLNISGMGFFSYRKNGERHRKGEVV